MTRKDLNDSYYQERLRQARLAFNFALGATATSAIVSFAGILLLLLGNALAGGATTAGGDASGTVSAFWLKLAKEANDRLDSAARAK
jgi:hypothetical protein